MNDNTNIYQNTYPTMHRAPSKFSGRRQDGELFLDRPSTYWRCARMRCLAPGYTLCQVTANMHLYILVYFHFAYYDVNFFYTSSNISHFEWLITKTSHFKTNYNDIGLFLSTNYSPFRNTK